MSTDLGGTLNSKAFRWGVAGVLAVTCGWTVPSTLLAQDSEPFADAVVVQEMSVVVGFDGVLSQKAVSRLETGDIQVFEGGLERKVTRIQAIGNEPVPADVPVHEGVETCPWTFMIYLDTALSSPKALLDAALALGQRADQLTELGCVDIVTAEPVPRALVRSSRSKEYVSKILTDEAKKARTAISRDGSTGTELPQPSNPDFARVQEQWDRLITFMASRKVAGPKLLFLVSDGFVLPKLDLQILSGRGTRTGDAPRDRSWANVVIDTAQTLASYGWLTVAMPHVPHSDQGYEPRHEDFNSLRDETEGRFDSDERRTVINFFGTSRSGRPPAGLDDRLFEAYMLPNLAPLRAVVEATAGELVWTRRQLDNLLEELGKRRLLWFQSSEAHDGRIRRLEVRLARSYKHLEAPWWKRSSTPHLIAEARLRRLAKGEPLRGRLVVNATLIDPDLEAPSGLRMLRVQVEPFDTEGGVSLGHVRISAGFGDSEEISSFAHQTDYDAPSLGLDWEYALLLEIPAAATRAIISVEDLVLEEWGTTMIDLAEADSTP